MFLRRLLSLRILKSYSCPISSSTLGTLRNAICDPGRNASTPMRSTVTPPLILRLRTPGTVRSSSYASLIFSHTRRKSAFFFERTTTPSWSSRLSRKTSTSSPGSMDSGSRNSSRGTRPSDLNPTSRITAESVLRRTVAFTISPSAISLSVSSYRAIISSYSSDEYSPPSNISTDIPSAMPKASVVQPASSSTTSSSADARVGGASVVSITSAGSSTSSSVSSTADSSVSGVAAEGSTSTSVSSETWVSSGVTAASPSIESSTGSVTTGVSVREVSPISSTGLSSAVICSSFVLIRCVPFGFGVRPGISKTTGRKAKPLYLPFDPSMGALRG